MRAVVTFTIKVNIFFAVLFSATLVQANASGALSLGELAPKVEGQTFEGQHFDWERLRGQVVLVDFWATWCPPCREELPVVERLYQRYRGRGFTVVGVNLDQDIAKAQRFARKMSLSFPLVHDVNKLSAKRYRPSKMPSSFVIGRDGKIRSIQTGFRAKDVAQLDQEIRIELDRLSPELHPPPESESSEPAK